MTALRSMTRRIALLVSLLLVVGGIPVTTAQEPPASPVASLSVGSVLFGGSLARDDQRDPKGDATLTLGTSLDGLIVDGERNAFTPDELAAFRLALPAAVGASTLRVNLVALVGDGVESLAGSGDWAVDPSWDTLTGLIPAPSIGELELRVYRDAALVAKAPIATWDVPRVSGVVTDPIGYTTEDSDRIQAAADRFADATDGQLWLYLTNTTNGTGARDVAEHLWAVNEDQMWPGDALAVMVIDDADVAVRVGSDLGFYVVPDEVLAIEDAARPEVTEWRVADAYDTIADGLVEAFDAPPPRRGATPTPRPSPTPATIPAPDLVGLTRTRAQAEADAAGLRLRVVFEQTDEAPAGTVISQDPRSGRPVPLSGRITITVASQPANVAVPQILGMRESDAVNAILDAGLEPGTRSQRTSESIASGRVITTDPRPGVIVAPGSRVDYVVSRGPASPTPTPRPTSAVVTVPDLRSMSEADALTELGSVGLRAGERTRAYHSSIEEGAIIRTDPAAGVHVDRNSRVDYTVSRGPRPSPTPEPTRTPRPTDTPRPTATPAAVVTVPDVRGMSEAAGLTELGSAGLRAGERTRVYSTSIDEGDIVRTDPAAGVRVDRGSRIAYVVSRGPRPSPTPTPAPTRTPRPTPEPTATPRPTEAPVTVPRVRGMREADALSVLSDAGLRIGERIRRYNASIAAGSVIRTDPADGEVVARGTAVDYVVSRGPEPSPTPTPAPTRTPRPTATPAPTRTPRPTATPAPTRTPRPTATPAPASDLLTRVRDAGTIRVAVAADDAPWSSAAGSGSFQGFDIQVAQAIADGLGVDLDLVGVPWQEIVTGSWGGRWDIAVSHLAVTDSRRSVLDMSQPYAFDPVLVAVLDGSPITDIAGLDGQIVCVAAGSLGEAWVAGTLDLTDPPFAAATAPSVRLRQRVSDASCRNALTADEPAVQAWIGSAPLISQAILDGRPIVTLDEPAWVAPISVAYDRSGADPDSLEAEIEGILSTLRADGTLANYSQAAFGMDLVTLPDGQSVSQPSRGSDPAFTVDPSLLDVFPTEVDGATVRPVGMNGDDLVSLLRPSDRRTSSVIRPLLDIGSESSLGRAGLSLALASVVDGDRTGFVTAARYDGLTASDVDTALRPLLTSQYTDPATSTVSLGGRDVTRVAAPGTGARGRATFILEQDGVMWYITATAGLAEDVIAALP